MRHATEPGTSAPGERKARAFENGEERDAALEADYRYTEHDEWPSTLAFVWVHAEELRDEFFRWWEKCGGEWQDQLRRWEVKRFGNQLEPGAHAIIRWRVIRNIDGIRKRGREPRVLFESLTERLTWQHATEAITRGDSEGSLEFLGRIVESVTKRKVNPDLRLPYREPGGDDE